LYEGYFYFMSGMSHELKVGELNKLRWKVALFSLNKREFEWIATIIGKGAGVKEEPPLPNQHNIKDGKFIKVLKRSVGQIGT